ncbi:MAG: threonine synthase [Candidatus Marinimicrobia bacterium]|nr:threonine synthase [Candidatus Neomarinimicrobiota bacterium]
MSISVFKCITCNKEFDIQEIRYRCDCGELLEVIHDLQQVIPNPADLKVKLDGKWGEVAFKRYQDILFPSLPLEKLITLQEGNTPLYDVTPKFPQFNSLKLKHEGMNPTLSFKDRGMVAGVSWANHLGCDNVICASTGDTSAAMAAYAGATPNMKGIVLLPKGKISPEQLAQPISFGALTIGIETDFDGCMKLVQNLTEKHNIYLLNSMNSVRIEGQKAIGIETLHQLNWKVPDWFVIPVGNAGNISAIGKGFRELYELGFIDKLPRLAGIQTEGASPLYESFKNGYSELVPQTAKPTKASAIQIGDPVSYKKAIREIKQFDGVVEIVSETELMDWKAQIDRLGISICPNSSVAVAGAMKLNRDGIIKQNEEVVVILTAHGSKFSNTSVEYHKDKTYQFANQTLSITPNLETLESALGL